jgi:hypothetical protein
MEQATDDTSDTVVKRDPAAPSTRPWDADRSSTVHGAAAALAAGDIGGTGSIGTLPGGGPEGSGILLGVETMVG